MAAKRRPTSRRRVGVRTLRSARRTWSRPLQQHDRHPTDPEGNVIARESVRGGSSSPFAAQVTADAAAKKGMERPPEGRKSSPRAPVSGKDTAVRSDQAAGLR